MDGAMAGMRPMKEYNESRDDLTTNPTVLFHEARMSDE